MPVNTIYVAKLFGEMLGVDTLNVFFYRQLTDAGGDGADGLHQGINTAVLASLVDCVYTGMNYPNLECFSIVVGSDYFSAQPSNNVGTRTIPNAERQAPWAAFSYKSNRAGAGSRSSYKRFSGLGEADTEGGGLSSAFKALVPVTDLQAALGNIVISTAGSNYVPIQVKSNWKVGFAPTENFILTDFQAAFYTSQVSRKT